MSQQSNVNLQDNAAALSLLKQLDPAEQKKAQEKLTAAIQEWAQGNAAKNAELAELRKIKVDLATVKYLVAEFGLPQAEVELLLRQNNNNLDVVLTQILNSGAF